MLTIFCCRSGGGGLARTAYDFRVRVCGEGEPRLDNDGDDDDALGVFFPRRKQVLTLAPRQRVIKHAPVSRYTRESLANGSPAITGNNSAGWNEWALDMLGKGSTLLICYWNDQAKPAAATIFVDTDCPLRVIRY